MNRTDEQPQIILARDEFTVERRRLDGHPEAVKTSNRLDVEDDYGNITTWVVDQYRLEGATIALVQIVNATGGTRIVLPPAVTRAIAQGQDRLVSRNRSRIGKRIAADKRARGEQVGNPAALAAARKARRKK